MARIKKYEEQVYAGVLGKVIGVYMGRPIEGWWKWLGPSELVHCYRDDRPVSIEAGLRTLMFMLSLPDCISLGWGDWWSLGLISMGQHDTDTVCAPALNPLLSYGLPFSIRPSGKVVIKDH